MSSSNPEHPLVEKVLHDSDHCKISLIGGLVVKLMQKKEVYDEDDKPYNTGCSILSLKQLSHADGIGSIFSISIYREDVRKRHCLLIEKDSASYGSMFNAMVQLKLLQINLCK